MAQTEQRLGRRPKFGTFDAAFDAWYVYAYFHGTCDHPPPGDSPPCPSPRRVAKPSKIVSFLPMACLFARPVCPCLSNSLSLTAPKVWSNISAANMFARSYFLTALPTLVPFITNSGSPAAAPPKCPPPSAHAPLHPRPRLPGLQTHLQPTHRCRAHQLSSHRPRHRASSSSQRRGHRQPEHPHLSAHQSALPSTSTHPSSCLRLIFFAYALKKRNRAFPPITFSP